MKKIHVLGNRHILDAFSRSVREKTLASAYLIEGPRGSGKRTLAQYLCALIVCSGETEQRPCFACRDCENVLCFTHPDVHFIVPEKDKASVSVSVVREANSLAVSAPIHAERRVFIIPDAGRMNAAAQNALLKNLEEPKSSTLYLLLCEEIGGLLPTIRSRAVHYRMEALSVDCVKEALAERFPKASDEEIGLYAALSGGSLGEAMEFLTNRRAGESRKRAESYLSLLQKGAGFAEFCKLLSADVKREELSLFYRFLLAGVRDALCEKNARAAGTFYATGSMGEFRCSSATLHRVASLLCELLDPSMASANVATSVYKLNSVASGT